MGSNERPTSVRVIGWFWIIVGGMICTGGMMGVSELLGIAPGPAQLAEDENQFVKVFLPAAAMLATGLVGIISAIYFLRLRYWARTVLEVLTWLGLALFSGFAVLCLAALAGWWDPPEGFGALEGSFDVMPVVILVAYAIPFAIVLYHLRGDKLKNALRGDVQQRYATVNSQRPTSVTVIGWFWIVVGGMMCIGAIFALSGLLRIQRGTVDLTQGEKQFFKLMMLPATGELAAGLVAIVSAIHFLRLRYWARTVLEVLTWLVLASTGGFAVLFFGSFGGFGPFEGFGPLDSSFVVLSAVILVTYAAPFAVVLYHLRTDKLKNALRRGGRG